MDYLNNCNYQYYNTMPVYYQEPVPYYLPLPQKVHPSPPTRLNHRFFKLQLSREQMLRNGFPMKMFHDVHIEKNEYNWNRNLFVDNDDLNRVCTRCSQPFFVEPSGLQTRSDGPICRDPDTGNWNNFHITDQQSKDVLNKFSFAPKASSNSPVQMYSIDVEMVYTARTQAVGRVTLVHQSGQTVLDVLVKPDDEVFDCVTKYSGLVMDDFSGAVDTLDSVKQKLFEYINDRTILIGHGLFGDLKALRIIHHHVIDTSVCFTNKGRRPSLRHLAQQYLGMHIQSETHCSQEDALAALKLVVFGAQNPHVLSKGFKEALSAW